MLALISAGLATSMYKNLCHIIAKQLEHATLYGLGQYPYIGEVTQLVVFIKVGIMLWCNILKFHEGLWVPMCPSTDPIVTSAY